LRGLIHEAGRSDFSEPCAALFKVVQFPTMLATAEIFRLVGALLLEQYDE
jgi:hypothetical protein